jgi:hypothetical protein
MPASTRQTLLRLLVIGAALVELGRQVGVSLPVAGLDILQASD